MLDKDATEQKIKDLEHQMNAPDFWNDKSVAQATIQEYQELKDSLDGFGKYDRGDAHMTLYAGAGGTDAEDFTRMLYDMYMKYCSNHGLRASIIQSHETDQGGFRSITLELCGKNAYGTLKNESGVHRLVRISPFNSNAKRHTSFAMVEVIPKLPETGAVEIPEDELKIEFSRSSGPGGQNVNKRETAVRIVHIPTDSAVHIDSERSQEANKKKALEILRGKLYHIQEEERRKREQGLYISKTTQNEWGSQIRSYVLHPYKLVKDHRTDVEIRDVESVLQGEIEKFIEAEREL